MLYKKYLCSGKNTRVFKQFELNQWPKRPKYLINILILTYPKSILVDSKNIFEAPIFPSLLYKNKISTNFIKKAELFDSLFDK